MSAQQARQTSLPIGAISAIQGPVVVIACDRLPPLHQALKACIDDETYLFEVHQHLDERRVRAITLHSTAGLRRGLPVYDTGAPLQVPIASDVFLISSANHWTRARRWPRVRTAISTARRWRCMNPLARAKCWKPASK
jgi:hypothetical protein